MPNYDFKSLSWYDFECLVRDLLQEEFKITLENFKSGRDQGIDLRYCCPSGKSIIIQCKHYAESGYKSLYNHLKTKELPKIAKLQPNRYILATSVSLPISNKDELKELLSPYCQTTGDIYGAEGLNNLLGKFPEIEKRNFKLWLTSIAVLERILHSSVFNRTEIGIENIKRKLKYYVENVTTVTAKKILERFHYCIITGIPRIGKSTLAEILLVEYLAEGYEAFIISNHIKEAFEVFNSSKKQLFYYDDFLGQTGLEAKFGKNEDRDVLSFVEYVRKSTNTRFIFTTRGYILNQAKSIYERLSTSHFNDPKIIIELSNYSQFDQAKILYNHIYFSNLPKEHKCKLLKDRGYLKIINHANFNPRTIESMTDDSISLGDIAENYLTKFLACLDDPESIWKHAFENQISRASRHLLMVLASFPRHVNLDDLKLAFESFHYYQSKQYTFSTDPLDFKKALKELDSNFIQFTKRNSDIEVDFHNPSVRDFIENYLAKNTQNVIDLFSSAKFMKQLDTIWGVKMIGERASSLRAQLLGIPHQLLASLKQLVLPSNKLLMSYILLGEADGDIHKRKEVEHEEITLFALEVAEAVDVKEAEDLAVELLNQLMNHLKRNDRKPDFFQKSYLMKILKRLSDGQLRHALNAEDLFMEAKNFLMKTLDDLEDYEFFIDYRDEFPEKVSETEYDAVREEFLSAKEDLAEQICSLKDPVNVNSQANYFEFIADTLDVDIENELYQISDYEQQLPIEPSFELDMEDDREFDHDDDNDMVNEKASVLVYIPDSDMIDMNYEHIEPKAFARTQNEDTEDKIHALFDTLRELCVQNDEE